MNGSGWSIGRADAGKSDILISGDTISAVHASLNYLNGKFYIIDNKSRNGSYIIRDNKKIVLTSHVELLATDSIVFGATEVSFNELLSYSSKSNPQNISALGFIAGTNKAVNKPKVQPVINNKDTKKIRCMDCMQPIMSNVKCPSCNSEKHLRGK